MRPITDHFYVEQANFRNRNEISTLNKTKCFWNAVSYIPTSMQNFQTKNPLLNVNPPTAEHFPVSQVLSQR